MTDGKLTKEILQDARAYVAYWMEREDYTVTHRGAVQERGNDGRVIDLPILDVLALAYNEDLRRYGEEFWAAYNDPKADPANWEPPPSADVGPIVIDGVEYAPKKGPGRPREKAKYVGPKPGRGKQPGHGIKALSTQLLISAFTVYVHVAQQKARQAFIDNLLCDTEDLELLETFVRALLPPNSSDFEMVRGVFAHWIWMIKKNMVNEYPEWHTMPILYGKQGGGKSEAIWKLLGPIKEYVITSPLNEITDSRVTKALSENFVVFSDELAGIKQADLNSLKGLITAKTKDYRQLGTNYVRQVPQSCSFIAGTNRPLQEQITDPSGNRRFVQVNCADKLDWVAINAIDFVELWRGVDEKKEGYIKPVHGLLSARQADERATTPAEDFIVSMMSDMLVCESIAVYQQYKAWCEQRCHRVVDEKLFRGEAKRHGWTVGKDGCYAKIS